MSALEQALLVVASMPRPQIEQLIEKSIALLDLIDGDPDLEAEVDEEDDDPGEEERLPVLPAYGEDQSRGPINELAALRERDGRNLRRVA